MNDHKLEAILANLINAELDLREGKIVNAHERVQQAITLGKALKENKPIENIADVTIAILYEDGAVSLNGRRFGCNTHQSYDDARRYLAGIEQSWVLYRLPGASGNLLEYDSLLTKAEFTAELTSQEENNL